MAIETESECVVPSAVVYSMGCGWIDYAYHNMILNLIWLGKPFYNISHISEKGSPEELESVNRQAVSCSVFDAAHSWDTKLVQYL